MRPDDDRLTSLRVAVTGHRDLDSRGHDEARRVIGNVIDDLLKRSSPAPVVLLTGMADGADQLVTDVAIRCGCTIQLVLPKPYDEYRSELSPEGAAALDELAARPEATVAIVVAGQDPTRADGDPGLPYHRLGLYLAKTAHVLIALWDGEMERKPGGTLDVLTSFLDRQFDSDPGDALPDPIQTTHVPPGHAGPLPCGCVEAARDPMPQVALRSSLRSTSGRPVFPESGTAVTPCLRRSRTWSTTCLGRRSNRSEPTGLFLGTRCSKGYRMTWRQRAGALRTTSTPRTWPRIVSRC